MIWERAYPSTNRLVPKPATMVTTFDSIKRPLQEFFARRSLRADEAIRVSARVDVERKSYPRVAHQYSSRLIKKNVTVEQGAPADGLPPAAELWRSAAPPSINPVTAPLLLRCSM